MHLVIPTLRLDYPLGLRQKTGADFNDGVVLTLTRFYNNLQDTALISGIKRCDRKMLASPPIS